ncbi:MAG: NusG domain II-containing protein [Clostridia bacterium]|nr:NusG domain II-containing protein [Clostridia bacterium]
MIKTRFGLWDGAVCALILLLALGLALGVGAAARSEGAVVTVSADGALALQKPLEGTEGRFPIDGEYPLTVCISGGKVWVEDSHCPGGDCQAQRPISRPGQSIVCLPGRITVAIRGGDGAADLIVG